MNGKAEKGVFDGAAVVDSCDEGDVVLSKMVQANAIHTPIYAFACTHHMIYSGSATLLASEGTCQECDPGNERQRPADKIQRALSLCPLHRSGNPALHDFSRR